MPIKRGWKDIQHYTQMSRKSVIELYEEEEFPIRLIKGVWTCNTNDIDMWISNYGKSNLTISHSTRMKK